VAAGAAAFLFEFSEIDVVVPVGVGVVVPRDGVEARSFGDAAGYDGICDADDRGGVHASGKFGEDGPVGAEPAVDGRGEDAAEVLFVLGVGTVTDFLGRIEIPIFADRTLSVPEEHGGGRWDGVNANVGSEVRGGKRNREPAGDVFFVESEGLPSKSDEGIEDGAPGDLVCVD